MTVKAHVRSSAGLATAALLVAAGLLAGCASDDAEQLPSEDTAAQSAPANVAKDQTPIGEPAVPLKSQDPKGEVPGKTTPGDPMDQLVRVGARATAPDQAPVYAARHAGKLTMGTLPQLASGEGTREEDLGANCTNLASSDRGVVATCGTEVKEVDATGATVGTIHVDKAATAATRNHDGTWAVGLDGEDRVYFYSADGVQSGQATVSRHIDDMQLMYPQDGASRLAVIDRHQTTVSDLSFGEKEPNGTLRIGTGVGGFSAGDGRSSILATSDTRGGQMIFYSMDDLVRHHETVPTGPSPWSVHWDAGRGIVWVSTTVDHTLTGYRVDSGTPVPVAKINTIGSVRHTVGNPQGDLLLVDSTGTRQLLSSADVNAAVQRGVPDAPTFPATSVD
ncbi:hypothetical protein CWC39_06655 [Corynebacterium heidelbergense]|uniref:Prolipoprotein LppL n=1 Tax=Corynebacterium heidelbergense TaxID=2055947 RepID=A0A364VAZ0_9CORY|nr:hypothetical protein CWC39_06655 [Corynebacterium heidelbergense]